MSTQVQVPLKRLEHGAGLPLPSYQTDGSAGADLRAALSDSLILKPGARGLIPTGLCLQLPLGFEGQVRPRSGLAVRHGVSVLNSPGTIDSDYRGEVKVALINLGQEPFEITRGMRIAQLVVAPVTRVAFCEVGDLVASTRGAGGFGHTGVE